MKILKVFKFVSLLKNSDDKATRCFITFTVSAISQIVFKILPGREHINFYICSGEDPRQVWDQPVKVNLTFALAFFITLFFYTVTLIRIKLLKLSEPVATISAQIEPSVATSNPNLFGKHYLADLVTIAVALTFYAPAIFVLFSINRLMEPESLVMYPNYMLVHFLHHGVTFLWNIYLITNYFSNSKTMRAAVWRKIRSIIIGKS